MRTYPNFDRILDDWESVVHCPSQNTGNELLHAEYSELEEFLRTATLVEVFQIPVDDFGAIGDAIVWLTHEQFLWLLPILLLFAHLSEEPIYATGVINDLIEQLSKSREWPQIKRQLSPETLHQLLLLSKTCINLGWDDERRITKRTAACEIIFQKI